ncbi:hypothetical protein C922_03585 [Plasmodium inui San Antonio 1]|uniref:RRM domain-containing protein n=1 Tax=Plasmodium inui San Antonio 1 TaxID=1237626 RepID=W7A385_9APIC|nr:hypothetical protein C922_03585 [Plasmodium inui San Antonio 1]EUD66115.1 hypothetical protein C922_03585 [Plasmodium inui San Antonio 1]
MNKITLANRYHDHMYHYMNSQLVKREEFTHFDAKQVDLNFVDTDASVPSGTSLGEEKMNSTKTQEGKANKRSADANKSNDHIANGGLGNNGRSRSKNNGMKKCNHNDKDNAAYNNGTSSGYAKSSFEEQKKGSALSGKRKKNGQVNSSSCGGLASKSANGTGAAIPRKGSDNNNSVVKGVSSGNGNTDAVANVTTVSVISCHNRRSSDVGSGKVVPNFRGSMYSEVNLAEGVSYHPVRYDSTDRHGDNGENKNAQVLNERAFEKIGTNLLGKDNANFEDPFTNNFSTAQRGFSDKMDLSNISHLVNYTNSSFENSEQALIPFDKCANRDTDRNGEEEEEEEQEENEEDEEEEEEEEKEEDEEDEEDESEEEDIKKGELPNMPSSSFSTYYRSDTVDGGTTSSDVKEMSPIYTAVYDCGNPCGGENRSRKQQKRGNGKRDQPSSDNKGKTSIDCSDRSSGERGGSNNGDMAMSNISGSVNQNDNIGIGKQGNASSNKVHRNGSVGSKNNKANRGNRNKHQKRKNSKRKNSASKAETKAKGAHAEVGNASKEDNDGSDANETNDTNNPNEENEADNVNDPCTQKTAKTTNGANKKAQENGLKVNQNSFPAQSHTKNAAEPPNGADDLVDLATLQNCSNSRGSPVDSTNASTMKSAGADVDLLFFRENDYPLEEHYMLLEEENDYGVQKLKEMAGKKDTAGEKDITREKDIAGLNNTFNILRNNLYHIFSDSCDEPCSDECLVESLDGTADRSRDRGRESVNFVDKAKGDTLRSHMHRIDIERGPMQSAVEKKGLAQSAFIERSMMERGLTHNGLTQHGMINQLGAAHPPLYHEDAEKEDKLGINDLRGDRSAFRGQRPLSDAPYSGLLQAPGMNGLIGTAPYVSTVRGIVPHNRYGLSGVAGVSSIGLVGSAGMIGSVGMVGSVGASVVNKSTGHGANGAQQSPFVRNSQKRTNFSAAPGKKCAMEMHLNSRSANALNGKERGNSHKAKKTGNEHMTVERPVILNNSQMLEAFMEGRLCLSCDSLDHPMPLCPNNSFVCPNCHNISHRGNDCPMKCRFCLKYHVGVSIMDCLKKAKVQSEKNLTNEEKNETNKVGKNVKSSDDNKVSVGPRFDITTRPDNSYGRSVYVSNLSEDITNVQLRDAINNNLENGYVVNIDRQDGYAFVELSNLNSTFQLVQKSININFRKLKIQFKKTGQFLIPDNLSLGVNNVVSFGLHRGGVRGATLVQNRVSKNATTSFSGKNLSNGSNSNALSSGSGAIGGNAVEVCSKLRVSPSKEGSNNSANGTGVPEGADGRGKYACKSTNAKHPKGQQEKKQQGQQSQQGQLQPVQQTQPPQTMQPMQLPQPAQSAQQRKNRQKDNLNQERAAHTDGASSVDKNSSAEGAILSPKKNKLVAEKNQEKGRGGGPSDGTVPTMNNGDRCYGAVGRGTMSHGCKNPHSVQIPSVEMLNFPNGYLLARNLDGAKIGAVAGLTREYYNFMCTNGLALKSDHVKKAMDVNNVPHLPGLYSSGAHNGANDLFTSEVAKAGLLYEGIKMPLKMANDMNEKNVLLKSMTTETSKTTATTTTASENMLKTELFNGVPPMRRSLHKFDDIMKETHLSTVMEVRGATSMNGKLTRSLDDSLGDRMFAGGSMSLSFVGDRDRGNGQFSGEYDGAYLGPYNDRFTADGRNDRRYRTSSGNNNNNYHSNHNSNVSEGPPNIDLKSIVDNAIEVNHDTLNYDHLSFANTAGMGLLHDDVPASAVPAPGAYPLGGCNVAGPYLSNENYTGGNKMCSNKQGIAGPYIDFEASVNGNNTWKDRNGSSSGNSGSRHPPDLKHSYNNICNDMLFGNHDIYDVFPRFNAINLDDESGGRGGSGRGCGAISDGVGHPFAIGSNQHKDSCNVNLDRNPNCGQNAVHQVLPSPNEETDEDNKIIFDQDSKSTFEADSKIKFVNLSPDMFQQLSHLSAKEDVHRREDTYVSGVKYKELDAIEKDLEKHIKALWNLRKIKLGKSNDIPHDIPHNEFV